MVELDEGASTVAISERVGDSVKKIVVVKDEIIPWHDENGILYVGIQQFLLDEHAMDI